MTPLKVLAFLSLLFLSGCGVATGAAGALIGQGVSNIWNEFQQGTKAAMLRNEQYLGQLGADVSEAVGDCKAKAKSKRDFDEMMTAFDRCIDFRKDHAPKLIIEGIVDKVIEHKKKLKEAKDAP